MEAPVSRARRPSLRAPQRKPVGPRAVMKEMAMAKRFFLTWLVASACAYPSTGSAQQAPPAAGDGSSAGAFGRLFSWGEAKTDAITQSQDGVYPELGGLITGAGLSIGPGFRHHVFGDHALVDVSAAVSSRRYTMMQSRLEWPRLFNDRLAVRSQAKDQDF